MDLVVDIDMDMDIDMYMDLDIGMAMDIHVANLQTEKSCVVIILRKMLSIEINKMK